MDDIQVMMKTMFNWQISKFLRKITSIKECGVCKRNKLEFKKVETEDFIMTSKYFWGVPANYEDWICNKCKKRAVLLISPDTQEVVSLLKQDLFNYPEECQEKVWALLQNAGGKILVVKVLDKIINGFNFSLTITGVELKCPLTEHNMSQLIKRYIKDEEKDELQK